MKINGNEIYMGTYAQRQQVAHSTDAQVSVEQSESISKSIESALDSIVTTDGNVNVSVSKEDMVFLCSEDGFARMKKDAEDLYAANIKQQQIIAEGRDPEDKFWKNTGDQWLTFSETLDKSGFYDNMSDEQVKEFEGLLERITSGMDNLSKCQYNTGMDLGSYNAGGKYFMSSADAATLLEASTTALQYMSENMIPDDLRDDFNNLIDMYRKHNEEILSEYKSPMESFNKVVSGIYKAGADFISKKPVEDFKYTAMLGDVSHNENEKQNYKSRIADIIRKYAFAGDVDTALTLLKAEHESYVSGNSDDKGFRNYVAKNAEYLFKNIGEYWGKLVQA